MKDSNLFWYLTNINLFKGLNAADLREVASLVDEKTCDKKELLYSPHSGPEEIYILKKGEVTLYTSNEGKRLVLEVLGPDSIFGRLSPEIQNINHFAEVTEDAYICTIPLKKFSKLIAEKPHILLNLLNILAGQLKDYQNKLKENLMTAEEKVLTCLNHQEKKTPSLLSQWFSSGKLTHAKIAEQTGLSRETVSRIMSRLKKEGKL